MLTIDPKQADQCFEEMGAREGVSVRQMAAGNPWPTDILKHGEDMPEHIRRAPIDDGEAALILDGRGEVESMIINGYLVGFRGMGV